MSTLFDAGHISYRKQFQRVEILLPVEVFLS